MSGSDDAVIRFRRRWLNWWLTLCVFAFFLLPFSGIFVTGSNADPGVLQRAICSLLSLLTLWLAVRVARCAIVATTQGLVVRNYLRTIRLPWEQILGFGAPAPYGRYRAAGLIINLHQRRSVSAIAFAPGPFSRRGFADGVVEQLEGMLQAHSSAAQGRPS